jgi:SAM-dependent methyltransferase
LSDSAPFDLSGRVYDLLYHEKDDVAETDYVVALMGRHHPSIRTILDLGCGTGRHARGLLDRGLQVVGVERSAEMAARARTVPGLDVFDDDVRSVRLQRTFDAVLALFHVVSYQTTTEDLLQTFTTAATHLTAGGLFVFDVWSTPAVLTQRPESRVRRVSDEVIDVVRTARPVEDIQHSIVKVHFVLQVTERFSGIAETFWETHVMRHLTQGEVELLAAATGFDLLHAEEFLSGNEPSGNTWAVCYVLQKVDR